MQCGHDVGRLFCHRAKSLSASAAARAAALGRTDSCAIAGAIARCNGCTHRAIDGAVAGALGSAHAAAYVWTAVDEVHATAYSAPRRRARCRYEFLAAATVAEVL